jgi:O-6-methylguanine DNA methyltransferase
MTDFQQRIYEVVKTIPRGKTLSYKQVATLAGRPNAFRAVGNILNKNYNQTIPCHRVIRSNGNIGGYNRGIDQKKHILTLEKYGKK